MVISSEFRMGKYRDDDHREDVPHFIKYAWQSNADDFGPTVITVFFNFGDPEMKRAVVITNDFVMTKQKITLNVFDRVL